MAVDAPFDARDDADRRAIARYRSGEDREGALTELFERYGAATLGFFTRRVGQRDHAAELNQNLYLNVVRALDGFRGESSFRTWLFRMAHHELSHLRRRWRTHLDERAPETPDELWAGLAASSEASDPSRPVLEEERKTAITRCLAELAEQERAVVIGQYYENVTLAELTTTLGLTNASGARALLIAAQRKLRKCLTRRLGER